MRKNILIYSLGLLCVFYVNAQPVDIFPHLAPFRISESCIDFIDSIKEQNFQYGWVTSYENPQDPQSRPVYVFYYMLRGFENETPTLFFNGGPQADSHGSLRGFTTVRDNRITTYFRMIFTDQRGTGCSSPYPEYNHDEAGRYVFWSTIGIVHDAERIRRHLGFQKWNILGQSFGGFIVQRYVEQYPQYLKKAIAHGGLSLGNTADSNTLSELRYEFQINVVKKFLQDHPTAAEHVKNIVNRRLCAPPGFPTATCGATLVRTLGSQLGIFGSLQHWPYFSEILRTTVQHNVSRPLGKPNYIFSEIWDSEPQYLAGQYIQMIDHPRLFTNFNRLRRLAIQNLGAVELLALTEFFDYGISDTSHYREYYDEVFQALRANHRVDRVNLETIRKNLESHPLLDFYAFSAQWDYFTPPVIMERATRMMGDRVHYAELLNEGHFSFTRACVVWNLLAYTNDQSTKIKDYCSPLIRELSL